MSRRIPPAAPRAAALAAALLGGLLAACRDEAAPAWSDHGRSASTAAADSLAGRGEEPPPGTERVPGGAQAAPGERPPTTAMREAVAVQIGGSRDSAGAARLRDSLAAAGWEAVVRRSGRDSLPWRVHVAPTREQALAEATRVGFALRRQAAALVTDSMRTDGPTVRLVPVHFGPYGVGRARWAVSPDRRQLLAVEEQAGNAGQVLPDAFVYVAEEGGVVVHRPAVWNVAPDPTWTRLAYGRAFLVPGGGAAGGVSRPWHELASYTNLDVTAVRRGAFRIDDRRELFGFAQPAIEWVHPDSQSVSELARLVNSPVPMAGGWRVRWSADGRTLAVGLTPPALGRDDAAPSAWVAVDARSYVSRGDVRSYVALADVAWTTGPALPSDAGLDPAPRTLEVEGGTVESRDGWVTARTAATGGRPRVLGPGRALAATRTGRFVAAVAPALDASGRRATQRLVVYQLR